MVAKQFKTLANGNIDIEHWLLSQKESGLLSNIDIELIQKAAFLTATICAGQTTFYGQPLLAHALEMAEIILSLKLDSDAVAASILVNAIQHANLSIDTIKQQINESTAKLVQNEQQMNILNTVLANIKKTRDQTQIDRLRKTFLSMASDIRVVLIKLAEQTCILRHIKNINLNERKRIAQETLDIYAPLANRLGIGQLKWELEDLSFHYIKPDIYKMIARFLSERRIDREKRLLEVIACLKTEFAKRQIQAKMSGRAKHIYSIYLKMQKKHLDYKNIYDASAIRILVPTIEDCYNSLSIVHNLWEHIPDEFDDYIASPKPNGYRSIHTALIGPQQKNLEIQIRTFDMHHTAEHGVAAHWLYKEKEKITQQAGLDKKISFLRQLLSWHKELATDPAITYPENKPDDRIYVFTPNGDIIDLPFGATPLDFAYHIHSELGHRCRGAKINGHIVQLTHRLQTGDRIDIITALNGTPSRDWLNKEFGYLITSRARAKVAQWFRQQEVDQYVETGKHLLEREFAKAGIHSVDLQKTAHLLQYKNAEALFASIGHGMIRLSHILNLIQKERHEENKPTIPLLPKKHKPITSGLQIVGIDDLLTRIAKCCKPIPGDAIIGYITQGRGISIHREDCQNIAHLSPEHHNRFVQANFDYKKLGAYYVDLYIRAMGQEQLLKEITSILANDKIDLISMQTTLNKKNNFLFISLTVQVHNNIQLQELISEINQLSNVLEVKRLK